MKSGMRMLYEIFYRNKEGKTNNVTSIGSDMVKIDIIIIEREGGTVLQIGRRWI